MLLPEVIDCMDVIRPLRMQCCCQEQWVGRHRLDITAVQRILFLKTDWLEAINVDPTPVRKILLLEMIIQKS